MAHIRYRIKNGLSKGIYEKSKLVGWILTHNDGAMGFLHVIDHARNKGYGIKLVRSLIKEIRSNGEIPFAYIEHDNKNSLNLVKNVGFKFQKNVNWFELA